MEFTLVEDSVEYQTVVNSLYGYLISLTEDLKVEKDIGDREILEGQIKNTKITLEFLGMDY